MIIGIDCLEEVEVLCAGRDILIVKSIERADEIAAGGDVSIRNPCNDICDRNHGVILRLRAPGRVAKDEKTRVIQFAGGFPVESGPGIFLDHVITHQGY